MILNQLLLNLLLQHSPVGQSVLSVQTMPECGTDRASPTCVIEPVCQPATNPLCAAPRWSTFYSAWVRIETEEHGKERLSGLTTGLANAAMRLLCIERDGRKTEGCEPIAWGYNRATKHNRGTLRELALAGLTAAIFESGGREDVQMGRGRRQKGVDGGYGRGPSNEGCFIQVLPSEAWRYSPWLTEEERAAAKRGLPGAREAAIQKLLGAEPEAAERCMEVGLRMLAASRSFCETTELTDRAKYGIENADNRKIYWWAFGMFSFYGTGPSGGCYSSNHGKTIVRVRLLQKFLAVAPQISFEVPDGDQVHPVDPGADRAGLQPAPRHPS
jgi:hypothetical protein